MSEQGDGWKTPASIIGILAVGATILAAIIPQLGTSGDTASADRAPVSSSVSSTSSTPVTTTPSPTQSPSATTSPVSRGESGGTDSVDDSPPNMQIEDDGQWIIAVDSVKANGSTLRITVSYRNYSKSAKGFDCSGFTNLNSTFLYLNSERIYAKSSYCNAHPSEASTVEPGETRTSFAEFPLKSELTQNPFALHWYSLGNATGLTLH